MTKTYIYLDKDYDLPLIVADSAAEMAEKRGIKRDSVYELISKAKRHGWRSRYMVLDDTEDET